MPSAHHIRQAVQQVIALRQSSQADPALLAALSRVKQLQAQRFARVYQDLLQSAAYGTATRFFLTELYADKDFNQRDLQFARIADTVEKLFPKTVVEVTLALAELHQLTEQLDFAMARAWPTSGETTAALAYVSAWRTVGGRAQRNQQLASVMNLGQQLGQLACTPGLRLMLKMMRGPAAAARLSDLQRFLESGFDAFAQMAKQPGQLPFFLGTIQTRESGFIDALFDAPEGAWETLLS
ncbi:MAG: FFLEELY motif protein [Burkholderiaceae bacterium]